MSAWRLVIALATLWESFKTPISIAFPEFYIPLRVDLSIHVIFFLDILISSRTTFFHKDTGEQIKEPGKISRHYFTSKGFILDLVAACPFFLI